MPGTHKSIAIWSFSNVFKRITIALILLGTSVFPSHAYRGVDGAYVPTDTPRWSGVRQFPTIKARVKPLHPKDQAFIAMVCGHIETQAKKRNLPAGFLAKLIWIESRFNPYAISHADAHGIAQFIPSTAKIWKLKDPYDPPQAIRASARLLDDLNRELGNLGLAAAGYNAGARRVQRWRNGTSRLPLETKNYVRAITGFHANKWAKRPYPRPSYRLSRGKSFQASCQSLPVSFKLPQKSYAKRHYNKAIRHFKARQYTHAIARYSTAIMLLPRYGKAYYNRGIAYYKTGDYDQSIADYTAAIKLKPAYAAAFHNRGLAHRKKGNYALAIADFNQTLKLSPQSSRAYFNRAVAHHKKKKLGLAIADYSRAIKLRPRYIAAYSNRAIAYQKSKKFNLAIAGYSQVIKLNPKYARAYYNRGAAYRQKGKLKRAIADYGIAIKLEPNRASAFGRRGDAYAKLGQHPLAIADFRQALALRPDNKRAIAGLKSLGLKP